MTKACSYILDLHVQTKSGYLRDKPQGPNYLTKVSIESPKWVLARKTWLDLAKFYLGHQNRQKVLALAQNMGKVIITLNMAFFNTKVGRNFIALILFSSYKNCFLFAPNYHLYVEALPMFLNNWCYSCSYYQFFF